MENTNEFVQKVKETQHKAELNKKHGGEGGPTERMANKQHGTKK